ncbi:DNA-binding response regulator [Halalkalibacter akibai JCM 9157]|uniref:DNA-binding response regulator n=2 Tax=Halalkalibacter akibai TaxID=1411 RepID=W4QQN9_HALA3|nr:DNA-binding response regulator [Halalkalibacter akibai JCM 9157]
MENMKNVLIVEDEMQMQKLLSICLQDQPFVVKTVGTGEEAIQLLRSFEYDLILLDIMLPGIDGYEVLKSFRLIDEDTPVILLTAVGETGDIVRGLNLGADDYITKPFEPSELVARMNSVIRRFKRQPEQTNIIKRHGVMLDQNKRQFTLEDKKIDFTKKEYQIFLRLFMNPEQVFTREELLQLEWNGPEERFDRSIDTHIKNIREKIREVGCDKPLIETVWGVGYKYFSSTDLL